MNISILYKQLYDSISVGNSASAGDPDTMLRENITVVINCGSELAAYYDGVEYYEYSLPTQELMESEMPTIVKKLEIMCDDIDSLRGNTILFCCDDGITRSMLALGYYVVKRLNMNADKVIDTLESTWDKKELRGLPLVTFRKLIKTSNA